MLQLCLEVLRASIYVAVTIYCNFQDNKNTFSVAVRKKQSLKKKCIAFSGYDRAKRRFPRTGMSINDWIFFLDKTTGEIQIN